MLKLQQQCNFKRSIFYLEWLWFKKTKKNFDFKTFLHLPQLGGVSKTMNINPPTCSKDAMAWRLEMDTLCHRYTTYPLTSFCVRYFHFLFYFFTQIFWCSNFAVQILILKLYHCRIICYNNLQHLRLLPTEINATLGAK